MEYNTMPKKLPALEASRNQRMIRAIAAGKDMKAVAKEVNISVPSAYRIVNSALFQAALVEFDEALKDSYVAGETSRMAGDPVRAHALFTLMPKHFENLEAAMHSENIETALKAGDRAVDLARNGQNPKAAAGSGQTNVAIAPVIQITPSQDDRIRRAIDSSRQARPTETK